MDDVKLAAIVSSFNRKTLLQRALPSLVAALSECGLPAAIVIFDAGSTDGSLDWLREYIAAHSTVTDSSSHANAASRPLTTNEDRLRESVTDGPSNVTESSSNANAAASELVTNKDRLRESITDSCANANTASAELATNKNRLREAITDSCANANAASAELAIHNLRIDLIEAQPDQDNSFSGGVNAATEFIKQKYPAIDFVLLYETDNVFRSASALKAALALLDRHPELGAIGFTVQKLDGSPAGFGTAFPTVAQFICGPHACHRWKLDSPAPRWLSDAGHQFCYYDVVYTSPLLVRFQLWLSTGGFDQVEFPFSDCDVDWAWRVRAFGSRLGVLQTDQVVHDNENQLSTWSRTRALHFHRARLKLLRRMKERPLNELKPLLFLRHALECALLQALVLTGKKDPALLDVRRTLLRTVFTDYTPPPP